MMFKCGHLYIRVTLWRREGQGWTHWDAYYPWNRYIDGATVAEVSKLSALAPWHEPQTSQETDELVLPCK